MKKVLLQLWQWIFKKKKKLIYGALALFICQICFFWLWWIGVQNEVFAEDNQTQTEASEQEATKKLSMIQLFHKIIYVCIYPILIVAWKVVDNSLVYWEIFNFDVVLWRLWNIVRNIANFWLWFIFIYKIFEFLIKWQKWDDIKKLLVSALIAWVWIQASWFIMAALIDVSTIATYWIWGLPMYILGKEKENLKYNPYVLWNVLYMESDNLDGYHMYLSNNFFLTGGNSGDVKFISECETFYYQNSNEELILAPKMIYYKDDTNEKYYLTEQKMCHLWDEVYHFSDLYTGGNKWSEISPTMSGSAIKTKQGEYAGSITASISTLKNISEPDMQTYVSGGKILKIWVQYDSGDQKYGLDVNNEWIWTGESASSWHLPNLWDILSGNYAWVFSTLYGSLLNAWNNLRLSSTSEKGLYVNLLNTALSLWHMIAIAIPLLVMVIVLVMRIGILRMAIVLSPVVILLKAFWFDKKIGKDSILRFIQVDNLLWVIFAPVVICFAVSLSTVLVRIIMKMNRSNIETWQQDILGWLIQLNVAWIWVNIWKLVWAVIWIAITWFLMWAAVKASELWKTWIIKSVEELSKTALWSMPVIPIPWKDGTANYMWVDTVFGLNGQQWIVSRIGNEIKSKYTNDSNETLNQRLDMNNAWKEAEKKRYSTYSEWLFAKGINDISWKDWRTIPVTIGKWTNNIQDVTFNDPYLNDWQREEIINSINGKDENVRRLYGAGAKEIKIWDKTWKFVEQEEDKDEKGQLKTDKDGKTIMKNVYKYVQQKNN